MSDHPTRTIPTDEVTAAPPGYELLGEIGRGGMGVVYLARDRSLDRDVAVKLLQDRYPADSFTARRFLDEARITGQLQHPGIPAVHQVGTLPNGRPFLAMKLIKGRTLADLCNEWACLTVDRGRFLAVFEQVCQAVGYAHAHRVIHRDLKPANVMVGAFGEVQVMDWGLAKVLTSRGGNPPARTMSSSRVSTPRSAPPGTPSTRRSPAACSARRRSCPRSRRSAPSTRSMPAATCSGWAASCA